eukprot:TRINITY_DN72983_c0_g1_i1.p1 TRINITY_DN72983_c0_g1~~TRINITY_DN72983_c0_g1_i1.p1  ORF type:complete len:691 (+),score=95.78 TRINITY_DN72983_c0_g1_i1:35-2074(+)
MNFSLALCLAWSLGTALIVAATAPSPEFECVPSLVSLLDDSSAWEEALLKHRGLGDCDCIADVDSVSTPLHEVAGRVELDGTGPPPGLVSDFVKKLVRGGARVLASNGRNATALHVAASRGAMAVMSGLCDVATSQQVLAELLAASDVDGRTPLAVANTYGQVAAAKFLLKLGAGRGNSSESNTSKRCSSRVVDAVLVGDIKALQEMGDVHANCLLPFEDRGRTLLHLAASAAAHLPAETGSEVVRLLLRLGADASRADEAGEVPLVAAVREDLSDIAGALLGAAPRGVVAQDVHGRTPLHVAAAVGARACSKRLLQFGASVERRDTLGLTPLALAERGGHFEVMQDVQTAMDDPFGTYRAARIARGADSDGELMDWELQIKDQIDIWSNGGPDKSSPPVNEDLHEASALTVVLVVVGVLIALAASVGICMCVSSALESYQNEKSIVAALPGEDRDVYGQDADVPGSDKRLALRGSTPLHKSHNQIDAFGGPFSLPGSTSQQRITCETKSLDGSTTGSGDSRPSTVSSPSGAQRLPSQHDLALQHLGDAARSQGSSGFGTLPSREGGSRPSTKDGFAPSSSREGQPLSLEQGALRLAGAAGQRHRPSAGEVCSPQPPQIVLPAAKRFAAPGRAAAADQSQGLQTKSEDRPASPVSSGASSPRADATRPGRRPRPQKGVW